MVSGYSNVDLIQLFITTICIGSLLALSFTITVFFYNKLNKKKSLEQIYYKLVSKKTEEGKISVMKDIHSYFQKYTFEELLLFNLKYKGIQYYNFYYFMGAVSFIFVSVAIISYNTPSGNLFVYLAYLSPIAVILLPMIFIGVVNKIEGIEEISPRKFIIRLFMNSLTGLVIVYFSSEIFVILGSLIFVNNQELINHLTQNSLTNSFKDLSSYIFNFKFESIGNQLSIAGFYFSLAVGGTVVLSLIDRYFKKSESLRGELLEQVGSFKELYSDPNSLLSLNLSDTVHFDYESLKKFEKDLSDIQIKLKCEEIENNRLILGRYKLFIWLVVLTYFIGIVNIFVPESFEIYSIGLFISLSILFGLLTINIYNDYRM